FSPAVLKPLLVKSVRWSEALAVAMESKGFDGHGERSSYEAPTVRTVDKVMLVLLCLVFPVVVVLLTRVF
ncbi:MAG: energy-coupling factor transporter transmembrane protein EcfT, partial [Clostridia bacterium]|nr:energy-coupling factor transporter transmembrane protein EcfT [Clostridia bacterium]